MAQSATDPNFAAPGATIPLAGTEDVLVFQGQQVAQAQLTNVMDGLVAAKGKPTVTGTKTATAGSPVPALTSLMAALVALGLVTDSTT
jgi:hypothetical protein